MLGRKIRSLSLTLLLVSALGLAAAQPSALHDLDVDGHTGIFGRATHTGKFVGSTCKTSDECYSKNCVVLTGSTSVKKCQRQPAGGPCFKDANCLSRNCRVSADTCITPSNTNGTCTADSDCVSGLSCDSSKCKAKTGSKCKQTGDCVSGDVCTNGTCVVPLLAPNAPCNEGSECISGGCGFSYCTRENGDYIDCVSLNNYATNGLCDRYQLGHTCVHPGDCLFGQCKGTCSNSTVGDSCLRRYQCTNGQTCFNGKCTILASGSQYPGDVCSKDSECKSGKCNDSYQCTGLSNGQSGCRSTGDCATGICKAGKCQLGADGDRCISNSQCQNLCNLDGVCFTPKSGTTLATGQPCKKNSQCLTGNCKTKGGVTRPTPDDSCTPDPYYDDMHSDLGRYRLSTRRPRRHVQFSKRLCPRHMHPGHLSGTSHRLHLQRRQGLHVPVVRQWQVCARGRILPLLRRVAVLLYQMRDRGL